MSKLIETYPLWSDPMTIEIARKYIPYWSQWEYMFSQKTLKQCLSQFNVSSFTDKDEIPIENDAAYRRLVDLGYGPIYDSPYMSCVHKTMSYKGKVWETTEKEKVNAFLVPSKYRTSDGKLLHACLMMEYPYLQRFYKVSCYHIDNYIKEEDREAEIKRRKAQGYNSFSLKLSIPEVYIQVAPDTPSIYVPLIAIKKGDPDIAIKRHTTYHKCYYSGANSGELANSLNVLETPEAKCLFECMKNNTPVDEVGNPPQLVSDWQIEVEYTKKHIYVIQATSYEEAVKEFKKKQKDIEKELVKKHDGVPKSLKIIY